MNKRQGMAQRALKIVAFLGLAIAAAGLGFDLLPDTRPGLHSLQILIIISGLLISLLAFSSLRLLQRKVMPEFKSALFKALLVTGLTFVALELVLSAIGYQTYFPQDAPDEFVQPAPWWSCEDPACHYVQAEMTKACASGQMSGRYCIVNQQGFHDSQDFVFSPALEGRTRVLALGDSFTFGEEADIGKSYVETIEARLPGTEVWNTGIFGVGTNQALAAFQMFAPIMQPHLTIYGFYTNDFFDNLFPVDGYFVGITEAGEVVKLQQYHLDPWGNVTKLENQRMLYYRWSGVEAPANEFERLLGATRLGSLFLSAVDTLGKQLQFAQQAQFNRKLELTRAYLRELRDASEAQGSQLLVMLIPRYTDLGRPGDEFRLAIALFEELGISYFSPRDALDAATDYAPDWHWNNAGHQKVGALLSDCIQALSAGGALADCDYVVVP